MNVFNDCAWLPVYETFEPFVYRKKQIGFNYEIVALLETYNKTANKE